MLVAGKGYCKHMGVSHGQQCCGGYCSGEFLTCSDGQCFDIADHPVFQEADEEVTLQSKQGCGDKGLECCYDGGPMCSKGACALDDPETDAIENMPCVCSSTMCVTNQEYACRDDEICDQSGVGPCGGMGQECCDGLSCNEEEDTDGGVVDLVCDEEQVCAVPAEIVIDQSRGCGEDLEMCCDGGCNSSVSVCKDGVCVSGYPCSTPGDTCCEEGMCLGAWLQCEDMVCNNCGGEGQRCCSGSDAPCSGDNMECEDGVCVQHKDDCSSPGDTCCKNSQMGTRYCSSNNSSTPISCNVNPVGSAEMECEACGKLDQQCCFPSYADAKHVKPRHLSLGSHLCKNSHHACMLDEGSANSFGLCTRCGREFGDPCCWEKLREQESRVAGTPYDVWVPVCPSEGLTCQEVMSMDALTFKDPRIFYRCVDEDELVMGQPSVDVSGACGGFTQPCCRAESRDMQCGVGMTCDLESLDCVECGREGFPCCPSLVDDWDGDTCEMGLGCTNNITLRFDRTCEECGRPEGPCCWDMWRGEYCMGSAVCTGDVGFDRMCV